MTEKLIFLCFDHCFLFFVFGTCITVKSATFNSSPHKELCDGCQFSSAEQSTDFLLSKSVVVDYELDPCIAVMNLRLEDKPTVFQFLSGSLTAMMGSYWDHCIFTNKQLQTQRKY
mmetsp:Transcript_23765/g.70265  ORF Transcript_23765/g.70265 Transcript_23765/m.70265 type:complete len:115 (-) Transcript_23765:706-1050(-)